MLHIHQSSQTAQYLQQNPHDLLVVRLRFTKTLDIKSADLQGRCDVQHTQPGSEQQNCSPHLTKDYSSVSEAEFGKIPFVVNVVKCVTKTCSHSNYHTRAPYLHCQLHPLHQETELRPARIHQFSDLRFIWGTYRWTWVKARSCRSVWWMCCVSAWWEWSFIWNSENHWIQWTKALSHSESSALTVFCL